MSKVMHATNNFDFIVFFFFLLLSKSTFVIMGGRVGANLSTLERANFVVLLEPIIQ